MKEKPDNMQRLKQYSWSRVIVQVTKYTTWREWAKTTCWRRTDRWTWYKHDI